MWRAENQGSKLQTTQKSLSKMHQMHVKMMTPDPILPHMTADKAETLRWIEEDNKEDVEVKGEWGGDGQHEPDNAHVK